MRHITRAQIIRELTEMWMDAHPDEIAAAIADSNCSPNYSKWTDRDLIDLYEVLTDTRLTPVFQVAEFQHSDPASEGIKAAR